MLNLYQVLKNHDNYELESNTNNQKKKKILIAPTWGTNFFDLNIHLSVKKNISLEKYDLFIRPHIMSTLKNKNLISDLVKKDFQISDGKINLNHFDLLITDWSGIYIEFAKIKKTKSILIQNKEKILNDKYYEFKNDTIDTYARNKLGIILTLNELSLIGDKVEDIFRNQHKFVSEIDNFFKNNFY